MMKKNWILYFALSCALFNILPTDAENISVEQARVNATAFINGHIAKSKSNHAPLEVSSMNLTYSGDNNSLYIFNMSGGGYVITSGNTCAYSILGYSNTGTFEYNNAPDGLQYLLGEYVRQIEWAKNNSYSYLNDESAQSTTADRHNIEPLVKALWGQSAPYNNLCPLDKKGNHYLTGCVATAMAEVMSYHKWPETYDWNNLLDQYDSSANETQKTAVAQLMADVGKSVHMSYESDGSSAREIYCPYAFAHDFGYSKGVHVEYANCYDAQVWDSMVYSELEAARPVVYGGVTELRSGHAFVIDGYQTDGLFHVNWGWNGNSNDYFRLNALDPKIKGEGAGHGTAYNSNQSMIAGIQRPAESDKCFPVIKSDKILTRKHIDGHNYIQCDYYSASSDVLRNVCIIAALKDTTSGLTSYYPLSVTDIVESVDFESGIIKPMSIDDLQIPDGAYDVTMKYVVDYDGNSTIDALKLYDLKFDKSLNSHLVLTVLHGDKTLDYPAEVKSNYDFMSIEPTEICIADTCNGKDYAFKTRVKNYHADIPQRMSAVIVYSDYNRNSVKILESTPIDVCVNPYDSADFDFVFKNLDFDALVNINTILSIQLLDNNNNVKLEKYVYLLFTDIKNQINVTAPVSCNEVHNGVIEYKKGTNLNVSFSGKIKPLRNMSNVDIQVLLTDTQYKIENNYALYYNHCSIAHTNNEFLKKDSIYDISLWDIEKPFEIYDNFGVGDTVRLYVLAVNVPKVTILNVPEDYKLVAPATAVDFVGDSAKPRKPKVTKHILNGRLVISKDGNDYSVEGIRL